MSNKVDRGLGLMLFELYVKIKMCFDQERWWCLVACFAGAG